MRSILTLCALSVLGACSTPPPADTELPLTVESGDGGLLWLLESHRYTSLVELRDALARYPRKPSLLLRTGASVTYADVAKTLDAATAAGVTDIRFASRDWAER